MITPALNLGVVMLLLIILQIFSLHAVNFFMLSAEFFFKINFFNDIFQECHQCAKQFGARSGPTKCQA